MNPRPVLWGGALAILIGAGLHGWSPSRREVEAPPADPVPTYRAESLRTTHLIESLRGSALASPDSWMALEQLASAHLERARLTGAYGDYAAAESLIAAAFRRAPVGAGPFMLRASLSFSLHRLDRVEGDLRQEERRVVLDGPARAAIEGMRGDVALQRGHLAEARRRFDRALALHDDMTGRARLAQCLWKLGDWDGAAAEYRKGAAMYHGPAARPRAWTKLQLGLMELSRDRLDSAMARYREAELEMPGWWLVEEHIAEVIFRRGDLADAEARYLDLVARTGDPEFMDQLARIHRERGDEKGTAEWAGRAEIAHRARMARFPEASWGHALGHFLDFGSPAEALDLAERNWRLRPNAEAREALAEAYRRAGRTAGAERLPGTM